MSEYITTKINGDYGEIVLNRPEKRNAFDWQFLEQLNQTIDGLKNDQNLRAIILRSNSKKAFCSGVDLDVLESFSNPGEARQFALLLEETMLHLFQFPLPVIADINGHAFGGGFGLAMAGDIRLMNINAKIRFPAVHIGAILPINCTIRLNYLIGLSMSKELLLTGRSIDAEESKKLGLVHYTGDSESIEKQIHFYLQQFREGNREALILQKIALNQQIVAEMTKYSVQSAENFAYLYASGFWKNITSKLKSAR